MTKTWSVPRVLRDRDAAALPDRVVVSGFGTSALWLASGVWVKDLTGSNGLRRAVRARPVGAHARRARARHPRRPHPPQTPPDRARTWPWPPSCPPSSPSTPPDRLWLLFAVLFLYGAAGVVHDAAESALVAAAVARDLLGDFNGLRMTATEGMKLLAPLAGAGLYAAYGGARVALLDAVTFVLAAGLYAPPAGPRGAARPAAGHWRARTAEGARHLRGHPGCARWSWRAADDALRGRRRRRCLRRRRGLGRSPAYAGLLYAAQGAGSVLIGLLSGPALRRLGERRFAAYGIALTAVAVARRRSPPTRWPWCAAQRSGRAALRPDRRVDRRAAGRRTRCSAGPPPRPTP